MLNNIETPLTLIIRMWQGACRCDFCQQRLPISHWWMSAPNQNSDYPRGNPNNRWPSVEADSRNGAVTMLLPLLNIYAGNIYVLPNSKQIIVWFPFLQDDTSLTLCSHSWSWIVHTTYTGMNKCFHNSWTYWSLYSGLCSRSPVCTEVCEAVFNVWCNKTYHFDIRSIDD